MEDSRQKLRLASHAMWAEDYEGALMFYTRYLQSVEHPDILSLYRINFELAIASAILRKGDLTAIYQKKLKEMFGRIEATMRDIRDRTQLGIRELRALSVEKPNRENIEKLLREFFPSDEDTLAFFVSPIYGRRFLRTALRNAEKYEKPQVQEAGVFKYTLSSELYRVIGRAYSVVELELENLSRFESMKTLVTNPNVCYVEDKNLRVIAAIQREGLVLCQYVLQGLEDISGAANISLFLRNLSKIFTES